MPPNESLFNKLKARLQFIDKKYLLAIFIFAAVLVTIPFSFWAYKNNKLIVPPPQTYSVVNFNSKKTEDLGQHNIINGKGIPNTKALITISPNGIKGVVDVGKDGAWSYQIPKTLKNGRYNLTITLLDKLGNLASVKMFPINITSNAQKFQGFNFIQSALAAGNIPGQNPCDQEDDQC